MISDEEDEEIANTRAFLLFIGGALSFSLIRLRFKARFLANKSDAFRPLTFTASDAIQLARHYGQCYWELSKARLSILVVTTSGTGYVLGSGDAVDLAGLCCSCAGTMMFVYLLVSTHLLYDFYNYRPEEPQYAALLGDFLQSVAQCGALLFFWGMKSLITKRQLRKKVVKPKTA
ncbi:hypothetical protein F3Y22_tig00006213pilonHSYRG00004 [Hibiscus syriacus]|uniref:Uncharacterized protein n=1 Tax=Hibiscus syriacus TaxID=106335 RepID=A0A6A3CDJ5_HIBSY|nr:hypothetical protein F3Y22_tig00006213pilonHSYRG00004 [Hibiscus syriacus]